MGKLTGILMILGGCAGLLWSWCMRQKRRQVVAGEFIRLFARWEYTLGCEKIRLFDFLAGYESSDIAVQTFIRQLLCKLQLMEDASGENVWRQTLVEHKVHLDLDSSMWEVLVSSGGAFFGETSRESVRIAQAGRKRLEECKKDARLEFVQRQKVYMPVGMLGGMLLIILFL